MSTGQKREQEPETSRLVKLGPKRVRTFRYEVEALLFTTWCRVGRSGRENVAWDLYLKALRGHFCSSVKPNRVRVRDNLTGRTAVTEEQVRKLLRKN